MKDVLPFEPSEEELDDIEHTIIYWPAVRIIAHSPENELKEVLVDLDDFTWNVEEGGDPYLTLAEISDQLHAFGLKTPYYVWAESALSGQIYLYGNYYPQEWQDHGTTKGYA